MPKPEDAMAANERGIRNVVFLIETQVRSMTALTEAGEDAREAEAMLRRLMDVEAALRMRAETLVGEPEVVGVAA